jgi:dihydroorotase
MAGAAALAQAGCASQPAAQTYDLVVKGGRVIDPARKIDGLFDVAIAQGRIASVAPGIAPGVAKVLDASGRLVVPGLIDIHTHASVDPTSSKLMLADGVTGWIEAGWQGADTIADGLAAVRAAPQKAGLLVNIDRKGVVIPPQGIIDLTLADVAAAHDAIAKHRDVVVGLKVRLSRGITGDRDMEVMRRAQAATKALNVPVMMHMGDSYSPLGPLLDLMKPGDIVTHIYAPPPHAILDANGKLIPEVVAARARGVIFDWGHGTRGHIVWNVAEKAVQNGFLPDTVSTDWTMGGYNSPAEVRMPTIMSDALSLGIPLDKVVAMATCNAARCFPLFEGRGTLAPGAPADVAVMELRQGAFEFLDNAGAKRPSAQKLFTSATVLAGQVVSPA